MYPIIYDAMHPYAKNMSKTSPLHHNVSIHDVKQLKRAAWCMKLPLCAGSGGGSDPLGVSPANFARGCFHDLNPQGDSFTTAPRLPFMMYQVKQLTINN
jgi:hypothetical protein